jgi:hypothetical protein
MRTTVARAERVFSVDDYLQSRIDNEDFTLVEFGHDAVPVETHQPFIFDDNRRYYGFESWTRDPLGAKRSMIMARNGIYKDQGLNIKFMELALGGDISRDPETEEAWYNGDYKTKTSLQDECADEVLISNVLGDPLFTTKLSYGEKLLTEASRLLKATGTLVVRETITPRGSSERIDNVYKNLGLLAVSQVEPEFPASPRLSFLSDDGGEEWCELEEIYRGDKSKHLPIAYNSYILFLQKSA